MLDLPQPNDQCALLVVIVNYRTPALTIACLESLVGEVQALAGQSVSASAAGMRVIVTDNASGDDSVERIGHAIATRGWREWVTLMPLDHNGGYAFGNNAALRIALKSADPPRYFLLLNPDTVVRPRAIQTLVNFMEEHPTVGIAGSRLEDPDGTPQCSAFRFHTVLSELDSSLRLGLISRLLAKWVVWPPISATAHPTDWVAGASMIVRRSVFETVGLLDEAYFMYYEEMDFCLQANKSGWSCWYVPDSRVVHLVGQSSGVTDTKRPPKRLPQYWFDSRRRYFVKNYGVFYTAVADVVWATSFASWQLRRAIQGKPNHDPPKILSDFLLNSVFIKGAQM